MIRNFLKIAIRNLLRNKSFSIINIGGLAVGMAATILIFLWIDNEKGFDRFHKNTDTLYEIMSNDKVADAIRTLPNTPEIMAPILKNEVPELAEVTRVREFGQTLMDIGEKKIMGESLAVDPAFLRMFSFPFLQGNEENAFADPSSIVLTNKFARKIFGDTDPMGQFIKLRNEKDYKVTGILKDQPANTEFRNFEFLISYEDLTNRAAIDSDWTNISIKTFAQLKPTVSLNGANEKLKNVIVNHSGNRAKTTEFLYPLSQLHLYGDFQNGIAVGGSIERVRVFSIIAIFILLIACINFMNLSTARSEKRAREVGIRKVVGARKNSLIAQFILESILMAFLAGVIALLLVNLVLPYFNNLVKGQLSIDFHDPYFWIASIGFILLTGFIAGSYPAFFLSAFKPVSVLKGTFKKVNTLITPRKILVVLQFTFAIALIICTIVVKKQVDYAQNRERGFERNNLIFAYLTGDMQKHYDLIKNELLSSGAAISVSKTSAPLTQNWSSGIGLEWSGKDPNSTIQINRFTEDGNFVKTAGLKLVQGRDIDVVKFRTDSTACLISESTVKMMGFNDPIGQIIKDGAGQWHVVGVIKDFIMESPYATVKPFIVMGPANGGNVINMRLDPGKRTSDNLKSVEKTFKTYNPAYPFEFKFLDEEYAAKFNDEKLVATLASLFGGLSIFICCLGLFGLAMYMAENRIKEIGVRKVLGATVANITLLLSKDFLKLVIAALLIASPLAWFAMNKWLGQYDYRTRIGWQIFLFAGLIAIVITIVTISYQSIRAALSNPVRSLRSE